MFSEAPALSPETLTPVTTQTTTRDAGLKTGTIASPKVDEALANELSPSPEEDLFPSDIRDDSVKSAVHAFQQRRLSEGTSVLQPDESTVLELPPITGEELAKLIREATEDHDGEAAGVEFDDLKKYISGEQAAGRLTPEGNKVWEAYVQRIERQREIDPENKGIPQERYEEIMKSLEAVARGETDPGLGMPVPPFRPEALVFPIAELLQDPSKNRAQLLEQLKKLTPEQLTAVHEEFKKSFEQRDLKGELVNLATQALEKNDTDFGKTILDLLADEEVFALGDRLKTILKTSEQLDTVLIERAMGRDAMEEAEKMHQEMEAIKAAKSEEERLSLMKTMTERLEKLDGGLLARSKTVFEMAGVDIDSEVTALSASSESKEKLFNALNTRAIVQIVQSHLPWREFIKQFDVQGGETVQGGKTE